MLRPDWPRSGRSRAKSPTLILIDLSGRNALRPAEARAARWRNLDDDQGLLRITNQMNADDQLGPVKTKDSARTIRLDGTTLGRLNHWRTLQVAAAERAARWDNDAELIATSRTGTPIERNNFARSLHRLCERAGIEPIRPYELRHTAFSHQADRGRSSWEIADWAGTCERMISDVYRHQLAQVSVLMPGDT
ncbi:MAG: tyrosine-type recombinase/integrase [Actinomycetota bacterium]